MANILLIDDEQGMRETLTDILTEQGYEVKPFASGQEAVKEIRKGSFDIVIADLKLPDVGGMQILDEAKEVNPESAVIVMTGYASMESAVEALNRGAFSYIVKPFNMDEVKTVIKRAFHQIRLFKENQRLIDELQLTNRKLEKAAAELDKANQAKSEFLSRMSHELRTPINAIIGFTEFLEEDKTLKKQQRLDVRHVATNAKSLISLINEILDLSKIEAGKVRISVSMFSLKTLIAHCVQSITPLLKDRPVKLEVDFTKDIPNKIKTDRDRLREIIVNLLSNAAKFTEKGKINILTGMDKEGMINISVSDTGCGIREEDLLHIFEEFRQMNIGTKKRYGGTGLGLAISKKLVHLLGGNIFVKSTFGNGTTFIVAIPPELKI